MKYFYFTRSDTFYGVVYIFKACYTDDKSFLYQIDSWNSRSNRGDKRFVYRAVPESCARNMLGDKINDITNSMGSAIVWPNNI